MKSKTEEKRKARELRAQGFSIADIAKILNVSKGSVSPWVKDICLSSEQKKLLDEKNPIYGKKYNSEIYKDRIAKRIEKYRNKRQEYQNNGAKRIGDHNFIAGCLLYWAEGSKDKNSIRMTNSDVDMLRFFVKFLKESCLIPLEKIKISCNFYTNNGLTKEEIEAYWLKKLELPLSSLKKSQINQLPTSSSGNKKGKLPYGVVRLSVCSTELVQQIYGAIQAYADFENTEWLG